MRASHRTQHEQPEQPEQRGRAPKPSKQAGPELTLQRQEALPRLGDRDSERVGGKNTEKPRRPRPNPNRMRKRKGGTRTDAQEKAMYNTNRRLPPLQITPAAVADQSSTHASCTVTLAPSQAGRFRR